MESEMGKTLEPNESNRYVSIATFAKMMGICKNSAYAAARRGDIPVILIGRRILVDIERLGGMSIMVNEHLDEERLCA
jgi:hypothetical protein